MKRLGQYLLMFLFLGSIIVIGSYIQLSPKKEISYYENRKLAEHPELTMEAVKNGVFMGEYETYITDHFAWKDEWVKGYIQWQHASNQTFIQDYFVSDDLWIYPKPAEVLEYHKLDISINSLRELANYTEANNTKLFYFSLPNRYLILEPPYPSYLKSDIEFLHRDYFLNGLSSIEGLHVVDVGKAFKENFTNDQLKELYYQTDHHWNVDGAFEGYRNIYEALNEQLQNFSEPPFERDHFTKKCYEDRTFLGSYNRQLYELIETDDAVCTSIPNNVDLNLLDIYVGSVAEENKVPWQHVFGSGLHQPSTVVNYAEMFTTDYRELTIVNPAKKAEGTKVLFIKDSYANPMSLWLAQHFYETTIFDIRHNQDRTLYSFLENHDYDLIAFLYNDTTLFPNMYDFHLNVPEELKYNDATWKKLQKK